jgi:hypothetical protein
MSASFSSRLSIVKIEILRVQFSNGYVSLYLTNEILRIYIAFPTGHSNSLKVKYPSS